MIFLFDCVLDLNNAFSIAKMGCSQITQGINFSSCQDLLQFSLNSEATKWSIVVLSILKVRRDATLLDSHKLAFLAKKRQLPLN